MKLQLKELYQRYQNSFEAITRKFPNADIAGPLLMSPNSLYQKQKNKLLIIGQETKGWGYHSSDIDAGMKLYEDFNLGVKYNSSPFWNITRKIERLLGNDEYSCAWTNISKFDVNAKRPLGEYLSKISEIDDLLIKEIEILNPNVVLFFTGPNLDYRIRNVFSQIVYKSIEGFTSRQFCKLNHSVLPIRTFRSYHPKSLRIRKIEEPFIKYLKENI